MHLLRPLACILILAADVTFAASLHSVAELPQDCRIVQFISSDVGWCSSNDALFHSTDGGMTWRPLQVPVRQLPSFMRTDRWQFELLSPNDGWVRTSLGLYWTSDGGQTWAEYPVPLKFVNEGDPSGSVDDLHFVTPQSGWALGMQEAPGDPLKEVIRYRIGVHEHTVYVPVLFRTEDHGRSWKQVPYPDLKGLPYRLEFADPDHGLSLELNATLYTHDGGRSWKESHYCASVNKKKLQFAQTGTGTFMRTTAQLLDAKVGWWSVEGDLFRTKDGGATWCQLPSIHYNGEIVPVHQLGFVNRTTGWAVPDLLGRGDDPLPLFETNNGGESWIPLTFAQKPRIEGCSVVSIATVFCWEYGHLYRLVHD